MNIIEKPRVYWNGWRWVVMPYYIVGQYNKPQDQLLDAAYKLCDYLNSQPKEI